MRYLHSSHFHPSSIPATSIPIPADFPRNSHHPHLCVTDRQTDTHSLCSRHYVTSVPDGWRQTQCLYWRRWGKLQITQTAQYCSRNIQAAPGRHVYTACTLNKCHPFTTSISFGALTQLAGSREEHLVCKNGVMRCCVVICLERGADCLHMVQLMPPPSQNPIISWLTEIRTGFYLSGAG